MVAKFFQVYATVAVLFLVIDAIWLGYVATGFYKSQLGHLMLEKPNLKIALIFYLMFAGAITILVVQPALAADNWLVALGYGAVLGFAAYGTYDVTNMATLKDWPQLMSYVDMAWGTALTAFVSVASFFVLRGFTLS